MTDRIPPHSIESEQALLGCIILDPKTVMPAVRSVISLGEELFYDLRHAVIFDTLAALEDSGKPLTTVLMVEYLRKVEKLESVGGVGYLSALSDATPSAANSEYYLEILIEKASLRKLIQVSAAAIQAAYQSDGRDVESIIAEAEIEILKVRRQKNKSLATMRELVHEAINEVERLHRQQGAISGLSTGLIDLDKMTDGLHNGEMIVIAGYPGAGKSAIAMNIAEHQAVDMGNGVGVFSLEMTARRLVLRMLASRARVNLRNVRDGFLSQMDFQKLSGVSAKLANANIHISDLGDMTVSKLRAIARRMIQQNDIKLFVVDYIQLLTSPGRKDQNREQEVAAISRGLKMMAAEFDVPVIALSQLNDDGKLRESRAIGQDADAVWTLRVGESQNKNDAESHVVPVALDIKKQREGPSPAQVDLTFFKCHTRFESAAKVIGGFE